MLSSDIATDYGASDVFCKLFWIQASLSRRLKSEWLCALLTSDQFHFLFLFFFTRYKHDLDLFLNPECNGCSRDLFETVVDKCFQSQTDDPFL